MYRMIIADDELLAREGLNKIIEWKNYNIEVIGMAQDGEIALKLCRDHKPEILLTDISMPFYTGIEIAENLKNEHINTKVILVSGYEDFSYAKSAISLKLEDYILKPVKIGELKNTIVRVTERLDKERESSSSLSYEYKNKAILQEDFTRNIVLGLFNDESQILQNFKDLNLPFNKDTLLKVSLIQLDNYENTLDNTFAKSSNLMSFAITNIANDLLGQHEAGYCCCYNLQSYIVLHKDNSLTDCLLKNIITSINKHLNVSCTIGCGKPKRIVDLALSFKEASIALTYSFYKGTNCVINIEQFDSVVKAPHNLDLMEIENSLIHSVNEGDNSKIEETIEQLFTFVHEHFIFSADFIQNICVQLLYACIKGINNKNELLQKKHLNNYAIINEIKVFNKLSELKEYITSELINISQNIRADKCPYHNCVVKKVKSFIDKNYMNEITIHTISQEISLTPNYISSIFKQETGMTIGDYLTEIRINNAKELLKSSDFKILEIAEKVGYKSSHYFSTLFKKSLGIHPKKYRNNSK